MPFASTAIAIASIVAAGATAGTTLYEASQSPGTPKPPSTAPTPLTSVQNANQSASVGQQLPTLQSLTGGSVSPEYAAQYGATQSGNAGDPQATGNIQDAINKFFGLGATGNSGLTSTAGSGVSGGGGILDLLSKGKPPGGEPSFGGGGGNDFVTSLLNSDSFKGLAG